MKLCRVTGNVVATVKHATYTGKKLMIVEPIGDDGSPAGSSFLAVDLVQAGPGDRVLVMQEGNGVRQILAHEKHGGKLPIRSVIIGIVDHIDTPTGAGA